MIRSIVSRLFQREAERIADSYWRGLVDGGEVSKKAERRRAEAERADLIRRAQEYGDRAKAHGRDEVLHAVYCADCRRN